MTKAPASQRLEHNNDSRMLEETVLLIRNSKTAVAVNLSIAFLTYLAIPSPKIIWLWLIVAASALRLTIFFWKKNNVTVQSNYTLLFYFVLFSIILQGTSWGVVSVILYNSVFDIHKFYLIAIVCGMSAGAILALTPSMLGFSCFSLTCVLPLIFSLLLSSDITFKYSGLMGIVFIVAVHLLAKRISLAHWELRDSRKSLERASKELFQHKNNLEIIIEERTKELRKSRENYRQLTEEINDAIFEVDLSGIITYMSPAISPILGYSPEDIVGNNYNSLIYPEDLSKVEEAFQSILSGNLSRTEFRIFNSLGQPHWVRTSSRPISNENDSIGIRGILIDVEDEKQAKRKEAEFLKKINQSQKLEALGTLAGGIAHDFNNLLMGIQGRTSLMSLNLASSDPNSEHVLAIDEYIDSASDLTGQLLGAARGGKYNPKPTDLNDVVISTSGMFSRTKKELKLELHISKSAIVAEVDKQQIEQVLLNMYVNAWQAMPDGGLLQLGTSSESLDESRCVPHNMKPGRYAHIWVTDSGVGMVESTRQQIFDPFFTTKEKGRGTGLGLASAYGIIKNHDGLITVYSEFGRGTTFNIHLPLSNKKPLNKKTKEPKMVKGSETIMLIDDEKIIIEVGLDILTALGYKVIVANGGRQAVDLLKNNDERVDLIILDMIMPEMDGGKTFDQIRELFPELPVILSSGYSINGQATEIMQRGCNDFIQKPFSIATLSKKIRSVLDEK